MNPSEIFYQKLSTKETFLGGQGEQQEIDWQLLKSLTLEVISHLMMCLKELNSKSIDLTRRSARGFEKII